MAGFLIAIPVALPSMLFFDSNNTHEYKDYAWAFCLGMTAYLIAIIAFYYLYTFKNLQQKTAVVYALGIWFVLVIMAYFFLSDKGPHHINE